MANPWRIEMLGGLRARRGEVVVERFRTRKTGVLLAFLAYSQRSQARETLIEEIWPDVAPETGRNNLRLSLAALRRVLEGDGEAGACVRADRSLVALEGVETDVGELEALLRAAATAPQRAPLLERALELYGGPLLPGFYESWIPAAAARLENLASTALATLIADLLARGENERARQWSNRGAELGLMAEFHPNEPARLSAENAAGAAPIFLSRFFGRQSELEQIALHLSEPSAPWLLTIIGAGGAGKTRLARQALQNGRALWISLEGLTGAARLDEALVAALGVATPPARAPLDCAAEALNREAPLLCFDNFEHLLPDGALWLSQLKARVATLRVIATSRARLELDGEALLELGALELPASLAPADVASSAAAALFIDRARAVNSNFSLFKTNEIEFARLLRQLDGLPLALELAAARAGILTPTQMLARLRRDADLPPLANNRVPRHHSLSATLDWSLRLLSDSKRALLARLSFFRAPFNLEAAHAVAAADDQATEAALLEQLARLRDASLLHPVLPSPNSQSHWFTLLETVRAGAQRLLTPDQSADLAKRHALYFVDLAERAESEVHFNLGWNLRLNTVWPDLSAALDWVVRAREITLGLRLASALWQFWILNGRTLEGLKHLETLLALAQIPPETTGIDDHLRARSATVAGFLALQIGNYGASTKHLQHAIEIAGEASNSDVLAWAFNLRGTVAQRQGNCELACHYFTRSLKLYREAPPPQRAVALTALAGALVCDKQIEAAQIYIREARALWRNLQNEHSLGWLDEIEGRAALQSGDLVTARAHLENSARLRQNIKTNTIHALDALGELEQREGHFERAQARYQTALAAARELGLRPSIASALTGSRHAARALGQTETARQNWQEALLLWNEIGDCGQGQNCREELRKLP